jgi:hypothetical protein
VCTRAVVVVLAILINAASARAAEPAAAPREGGASPGERSYRVVGVKRGDTLMLRRHAGADSEVVADVPPDQKGLRATGNIKVVGGSTWREVEVAEIKGWANQRYLQLEERAAPAPPNLPRANAQARETLTCNGGQPAWTLQLMASGEVRTGGVMQLPTGARATRRETAIGRRDVWSVDVVEADGRPVATMIVKDTGNCEDTTGARYRYEMFLKRAGADLIAGCCDRLPVPR